MVRHYRYYRVLLYRRTRLLLTEEDTDTQGRVEDLEDPKDQDNEQFRLWVKNTLKPVKSLSVLILSFLPPLV